VRARRRGAFTVAITNDPTSELAQVAEAVVPLEAGPELAVAATKTYLNQLAALALLAGHVGENGKRVAEGVKRVSEQLEHALPALEVQAQALALPFAYVGRMFVIGRGPEFATARETALKLLETCRLAASPLTATDLVHGPVAVLDPLFPVWTIASHDQTLAAVQEASQHVRRFGSTIVACGNAADEIEGADYRLPVPSPDVPLLSPLLSVVPGQLFAAALARGKGFDPDRPRGLTKVTLAQ
jgi:glucosamine--fructose-6-phosphate aminotransferase (isomerizing)